jgi:hypothetical protein
MHASVRPLFPSKGSRIASVVIACALALAAPAQAEKGRRLLSPYQPAKAQQQPLHPNAMLTANVTNKKGKVRARTFLSLQQYNEIRDGALDLVRQYPPSQYFYVPLGRSPTAIAAFLENIAQDPSDLTVTVPASGLRHGVIEGHENAWFEHLDSFLPSDVLNGKRKILLIDRSTTGATLQKSQGIFQQYLAKRGSNVQVDIVAFSRRQVPIPYIDVNGKQELIDMNNDNYVPWAKWPKYEVGVTPRNTLQPIASYETFKQALRQRMERDPQLHTAITSLGE